MKWILFFLFPVAAHAQVNIQGTEKLPQGAEWIYISYNLDSQWVHDSTRVTNHEFTLRLPLKEPLETDLWVKTDPKGGKYPRQTKRLFVQPGDMTVTIDNSIESMVVKGSHAHDEYLEMEEKMKPYEVRLKAVYKQMGAASEAKNLAESDRLDEQAEAIRKEMAQELLAPYIRKYPASPIAMNVIQDVIGSWINPTLESLLLSEKLMASLPASTKKWISARAMGERIAAAKRTSVGVMATDFTLQDSTGKNISLSSFRGKYVLVDFWASWCVPCRANNPNLIKAYDAFRDQGFTVLGVAFDGSEKLQKDWRVAMVTDKLPWVNVNDITYPAKESVGRIYNIGSVPQNVLVDPAGKIIAKNVEGKELAERLPVLLKKQH